MPRASAAAVDALARSAGHDPAIVVMAEIVGAYGVRGWVKVKPHTERPDALLDYPSWWLRPQGGEAGGWQCTAVQEGREHSGLLLAQLAGIASREAALRWRGARVGVPRGQLPEPAPGEIYRADLVGLDVFNRSGARLGKVVAVEEYGAHPLLRVEGDEGGATRLIPLVPAYVNGVDVANRRIDVDWEADY